ncbi:DUF3048 domain-containing protein [Candidatus Microgenomates bacterium]|nr:DUF3048 domain-containing protein [Candidatus Microgenomates bacterium]
MKSFITSQNLRIGATLLGLFLLAAGLSWLVFAYVLKPGGSTSKEAEQKRVAIDKTAPKTETCPLNGEKFTKAEREIWEKRRPLTVMIENHAEARPQSGITSADVVYEAVAEGGITRFLAIFYCGAAAEDVLLAPVRSVRVYYIDWASEYGEKPIFAHVGGANDLNVTGDTVKAARAIEKLVDIGWRVKGGNDFDTGLDSGFPLFARNYDRLDHPVATEHTMTMSTDLAYKQAEERGFGNKDKKGKAWDSQFVLWKFKDAASVGQVTKVSFPFWQNQVDYDVVWILDAATGLWKRENGGKPHTDLNNNEQIQAANVVIMFTKEQGPVDKNKHLLYQTTGSGEAIIFQNGNVIRGTWKKADRTSRTKFVDTAGKEIPFVPGKIWIEVLPTGTKVTY